MRRILNTSTAILVCLSLVAPDIAMAQQPDPQQDQLILQQKKLQQQKAQREKQQKQQELLRKKKLEQQAQQREKRLEQERQQRAHERRLEEQKRLDEQQRQLEHRKQAERRRLEQEKRRLEDQKQQQQEQQRQLDQRKAEQERQQREKARRQQEQHQKQVEHERQRLETQRKQQEQQQRQLNQRKAEQARQQRENAQRNQEQQRQKQIQQDKLRLEQERQRLETQRQQQQRQQQQLQLQRKQAAERQREIAEQQRRLQLQREAARRRLPPPAGPIERLTPEQLRRQLQQGGGGAWLPAPEARHRQTDWARRAAEGSRYPSAAALAAAGAGGRLSERRITQENARRADQDFRNRFGDSRYMTDEELRRELQRRERQRDEARRDDDDDNDTLKTIGALLLAGAAGMAVGRMLDGRQVAMNTGDRLVMSAPDGSQQVLRDDNALLYRPGSDVQTETFQDGSTRTTVMRADGSRVVTIRDANANILRRVLIRPDGSQVPLIDDTAVRPVQLSTLPQPQPVEYYDRPLQEDELRAALLQESGADRRFTLGQVRDIPEVRSLVAPVNVPQITFDSGSALLAPSQADQLATLGGVMREAIDQNPNEMFLIEGYTDGVGSKASNLALSDRRAESLALALTDNYQVPPENMVVQGYGEQFPLVPGEGAQPENRRVAVRRITDLLAQGNQ